VAIARGANHLLCLDFGSRGYRPGKTGKVPNSDRPPGQGLVCAASARQERSNIPLGASTVSRRPERNMVLPDDVSGTFETDSPLSAST